ncbi:MAG: sodium-independent anion transporter, partial [Saprospiraceae bacterium]|nr:sodium-independent anion transporter [Saprospiraceae bacterium]
RSHHIHEILIEAGQRIGELHWPTFLIGLGGIGLILLVKKVSRAIPGPLLAVVFGILAVWLFGLSGEGVKIVGTVP